MPAEGGGINVFFTDTTQRHRAQERLAVLAQVSAEVAGSPDAVQSMSRIPRLVVPVLADWAVVTVLEDDGRPRDVGSWHGDPALRPVLSRYTELRLEALPATDPADPLAAHPGTHPGHRRPRSPTACRPGRPATCSVQLASGGGLYLPLLGRGRTLGVLTLWWSADRTPDPEDLAAARETADRIGLALDNGRLYRQQAALAEELQRSLLTQPFQPGRRRGRRPLHPGGRGGPGRRGLVRRVPGTRAGP